jgi:hypothetical protein
MGLGTELVRLTLLEARRSRLTWLAAAAIALAFAMAQFLSQVALMEGRQIQLSLIAGALRLAGVFLIVTFVISSMVRETNDRITELLLSQPVPRWSYFLSRLAGYAVLSLAVAIAFTLPLIALAPTRGALLWGASFACELLVMATVSLFCVVSMRQILPSFAATGALYLLARSVETMRAIASHPVTPREGWTDWAVAAGMDVVAMAMPALDRFSLSRWLYEGAPGPGDMVDIAVQTAVYVALVGAASMFDLYRRNY